MNFLYPSVLEMVMNNEWQAIQPYVPAPSELASASYDLTSENCVVTSSNAGLIFPAGATLLPATGHGWFFGFWFHVPHFFSQGNQVECLAQRGISATATGVNESAIYINQSNLALPLQLFVVIKRSSVQWYPIANQPVGQVVERGKGYLLLLGQIGTLPFISLMDVTGNVISNSVGPTTSIAGAFDAFTGLGCAVGASGNERGFEGRMQNAFFCNGEFPNTAGTPDVSTLIALAKGQTSPFLVVNSGLNDSPSYRYFSGLNGPNGLAADVRGVITGAMVAQGAAVTPVAGNTIRELAALTLAGLGDGYVWGIVAGKSAGDVHFDGTYSVSGAGTPMIEARLVRVDDGLAMAGYDWQQLPNVVVGSGNYSGFFSNVPAGVGFMREVRLDNQSASLATKERHGVGIVLLMNAQSQAAELFYPAGSGSGSGTGAVTPTDTANVWFSYLGINRFLQGASATGISDTLPAVPNQTNSPIGDVTVIKRVQGIITGLYGDGILILANKLMALTGYPVMIGDGNRPGHSPMDFYADRQIATQAGPISGFAPDGVTTSFNFTLASPNSIGWPLAGVNGYGPTVAYTSGSPIIKAGTLVITCGAVIITDNGVGGLIGTGVSSGTVNYATGACTLVFNSAPASTIPSALWSFIADYQAGSSVAKTTLNGYSTYGIVGQQHSGFLADLYYKLGGNIVTAVIFPWWTTLVSYSVYSSSANYATSLAALTAQWDAIKYAHKAFPACARAIYFFAPAARECPTSGNVEEVGRAKYGAHRVMTRDYVRRNTGDSRLLAEAYDLTISNNSGPHEDIAGYQEMGERDGVSIAGGLGVNISAEGPRVLSVSINSGRTIITLIYWFPDVTATAVKANDGVTTTGIKGFEVGHHATSQALAFTNRVIDTDVTDGFVVAIGASNVVTLTKSSGSWLAKVSLSYAAGNPVFTGVANGVADGVSLGKLLCDDTGSGKYVFPVGSAPAGSPAATVLDMVI